MINESRYYTAVSKARHLWKERKNGAYLLHAHGRAAGNLGANSGSKTLSRGSKKVHLS